MSNVTLPAQARVVIVGGGVIGTSIAYHLTRLGWQDVVVLESNQLTSGTTWHAAGLMVTFGSTSETSTEMRKYTRDLYSRLEQETGLATGFKPIGFIEVAADADRLEEYRRVASFNRFCGIDVQEISPAEIKQLFPLARVDDLLAGFYVPEDGRVNPVDVTMSLAKGARMQGARIAEGVAATGLIKKQGAVAGVRTLSGDIEAEFVVNCAGMWARQLGEVAGVNIPNQAAEHYYLITEPIIDLPADMPVLEDPSHYGYYREEGGGLMVGMFEPICAPWHIDRIPEHFSFDEINPDVDRMMPFFEKAMSRVPISMDVGIKKLFCGPESFTPDLLPIVGEAPELKNYFVAAGLNSIGILTGGGLGRIMAHWIVNGRADVDVTAMNIDRLHSYQNNPEYRKHRTVESLGKVYKCHYPTMSPKTARGAKKSPFYDRLAARGAYFRDVSGWEGADWYAPQGKEARVDNLSWGRENWFTWWQEEHMSARQGVILMDMSFMSKFLVQGNDVGAVLNYISANEVDANCNQISYTQWLNEDGRLEADLTVTKLEDEKFLVVVTDTMHRHAETWLKNHTPDDAHAFVTDMTSAFGQLNIQGPKSRQLMQALTNADLSNEAFPFRHAAEIDIGYARALCIRITYLGELGYELYIPAEQALHVYDRIVEVGREFGLKHAGLKALASLRLEKGYRDYGHDIDNTDDPFETGLGFAVNLKKPGGFIGMDAAAKKRSAAPYSRRLAQVLVKNPEPLLFHAEVVKRNGAPVGYVRAGSYGFSLGGAIGLFMIEAGEPITRSYIKDARWEIEIAGVTYPAEVSLQPMYDPRQEKVKA
ncbi:MAG: FAD-dependent oxidoreductase [Pseudomonadales bacterium]|nr:FAD-dependent oxidoreductase [Pseudomonadales bacterium]MDP7594533.1 FAD-dependent oxidoreductase [Pseudomonadales bacterium]HJN50735.1 FAD-dependent oxidoreductase [Pseudomonadales bacterium]